MASCYKVKCLFFALRCWVCGYMMALVLNKAVISAANLVVVVVVFVVVVV